MNLLSLARKLAVRLARRQCRIVFAESCTAGLVAASLARVPGVSDWLCGSAVVYRELTKQHWIGVPLSEIEQYTATSEAVARSMALGVLRRTVEADLAASVTGHLGPNAPSELDGRIFIGIAFRRQGDVLLDRAIAIHLRESTRHKRQQEATAAVLQAAWEALD